MNSENELIAILNQNDKFRILTTKGTLDITDEDVKVITQGSELPSGIKNSPIIEGIPLKIILNEILKILKESKKRNKEKQEKQTVTYRTRFTFDGIHYDEFLDPVDGKLKFIKHQNGTILGDVKSLNILDPDELDKDIIVKPAPQIAQTKTDRIFEEDEFDFIKFPPRPIPYGTLEQLYIRIRTYVHKYVEVKNEDEVLVTLWIMKAVLSDVLKDMSFPFIHILAPFGHGKSRLLLVMAEITPYGFYLVNISSAPLKRVSQLYSPIVYVDEKANMDSDTAAIINAKFNKNTVVLNADKEIQRGINSVIGYKIYGPLVLAGRTPFKDDAIESKAFQISQDFELMRKDIPRKIKGKLLDEFKGEAQEIRGQLLQFRIDYADKINDVQGSKLVEKFEGYLEPRLYEILSFFDDLIELIPNIKREILELLKYQIRRNVEVAMETPNGIVASTFLSILENTDPVSYSIGGRDFDGIRLADIYDEIGVNYAKQTGKILQALGISTDRPRISIRDRDGNEKLKRITVVRIPDQTKIKELRARYDLKYVEETLLPSIEQDLQASLDNEVNKDNEKGNTPQANDNENSQKSEQSSTNQNGQVHVDNEDEEDAEKGNPLSSDNNEKGEKSKQISITQDGEIHVDDEDDEDYEKGKPPSNGNNNEKKEGDSQNERPHSPLRPDSSQELGQNEKNDLPEVTGQKYEWDYFRVLDDFDYYFSSGERHRYKKDQIIKFSIIHAGKYVLKGLLKPACPNGHYDPISRECIPDIGGGSISNE